jgi:hypothetical protein
MAFSDDFDWQRALIPEIKRVLANYLISEAPVEEDMKRNTDLLVLKLDTIRVACRLRRHEYLRRYSDEFTIRAGRPSGVKTEFAKVISGWGDYIFYGFASEDMTSIDAWLLGDLSEFRYWVNQRLAMGRTPWMDQENRDGSSNFYAFRVDDLPPSFIVGRKQFRGVAA